MGLFTADFARRRGASVLLLDQWRLGDPRAASFSLTRSIRNDYLDPEYARLAFEARKLWLDFQRETGASFLIECGSGTYVRSLIADLGDAYCLELRRTAIGPFDVRDAVAPPPPGARWSEPPLIALERALAMASSPLEPPH